jgi:hypothetical protein
MSLIDWSDAEEMFGLLVDYVADEEHAAHDAERRRFLTQLRARLEEMQDGFARGPSSEAVSALRAIHRAIGAEYEHDVVVGHLGDCVDELERIAGSGNGGE